MTARRAHPVKPVTREMAEYSGYRYSVGGGSAFFVGLLTAGFYPGVAVVTRMRRHRADESQLYFRMVDELRGRLGSHQELDQVEALADRMRRKAARGVVAILAAVAISLAVLATGPALIITYNTFYGLRVHFFGRVDYYYPHQELLTTGIVMAAIVVTFLVGWAVQVLTALDGHRRRTVDLLTSFNKVAHQLRVPPVRIYPAGLSAGQVFWLLMTVFLSAGVGLGLAGLLVQASPGIKEEYFIILLMALSAIVLPTYVWVAMVWSNHVRRWNARVLGALSESLGLLLYGRAVVPPPPAQPRFCRSPTCGAANRPAARYCCRCGQPL